MMSGFAAFGVGQAFDYLNWVGFADWCGRAAAHGLTQGGLAEMEGGEFRHGFYSAAFASAASPLTGMINTGDGNADYVLQLASTSVIGGTAAKLGGGKFENGAITAAFVYMFNQALESASKSAGKHLIIANGTAPTHPGDVADGRDFIGAANATKAAAPNDTIVINAPTIQDALEQIEAQYIAKGSISTLSIVEHAIVTGDVWDIKDVKQVYGSKFTVLTADLLEPFMKYLTKDASIVFYGCFVAQGTDYMNSISSAFKGKSIYGSPNGYTYNYMNKWFGDRIQTPYREYSPLKPSTSTDVFTKFYTAP